MYKPDEDIDRLSRDAAEHYHAPGKPSWDALQQILDKELPQEKEKKRRGFFFFWLLLGLSVAGTGIWYGITVSNKHPKTTLTENVAVESSKEKTAVADQPKNAGSISSANKTAVAASDAATDNVSKKAETSEAGSKTAATAIVPNKGTPANAVTEKKIRGNNAESNTTATIVPDAVAKDAINVKDNKHKPVIAKDISLSHSKKIKNSTTAIGDEENNTATIAQSSNKKLKLAKVGNQTPLKTGDGSVNKGIAKQYKHGVKKAPTVNSNSEDATANEILTGIAANNNSADKIKDNADVATKTEDKDQTATPSPDTAANKIASAKPAVLTAPPAAEKKDSAVAAKKKSKSKPERAINFGIVAGIDKSTVKFTDGDHAGYNLGLTGGYQFSKHWSVSTGVIYTKKNYKLNGNDFHPPAHYWTQYVDLQKVEGYCKMWEIPLQARYTFNPGAKTAFFAGAGLSSYFMTRQYYDYSYKNSMGWPMTGAWGTDSTFKHVFSILDLSVGFEKQIGRHLNLQVEPYAKVPLGGVGFGNMRLSSFGINFSVQYRHKLKR